MNRAPETSATPPSPTEANDKLTEHEYDGIREYDNPTPGWWTWLFALSFFFALFYMTYYHVGNEGSTIYQDYDHAVADNLRLQFAGLGQLSPDEPTMLRLMNDPQWIKFGRSIFESAQCTSCHGPEAGGLVGPNLTDDYWKNVKTLADIPHVIANGAANGAMPAWKTRLQPNEIILVAAYVASLRGSHPTGAVRPPEGQKIAPWPAAKSDLPAKTDKP